MKIADYSIKHGPTVIMLMITAVVFGVISLLNIPQERVPDIAKPSILIVTQYPGVGPKDIEQEITKPIEDAVSTLSGITKITSDSVDSFSLITLEFNWSENLDSKLPTLREKVNTVMSQLPSDISGPPDFYTFSATDLPILTYVVQSESDIETIKSFVTNQAVPYFQRIPGVASVSVKGTPDADVRIVLDLRKLSGLQISPIDVLKILKANNVNLPAGNVSFHGGSLNLRSVGQFSSLADIRNVVVGVRDRVPIHVRDIATVTMGTANRNLYSLYNGKQALVIDVTKQRGSDTIKIIDQIKAAAKKIEQSENGNIHFVAVTDESVDIHRSVSSVANSALLGALLAVVILFL
ncbi:MAG TPA: efflux RND transporter permease subunit, partial [Spirochaetia bacterium]|nr:efflux RND transporter permease subunit [Spirochaetia bacterium]